VEKKSKVSSWPSWEEVAEEEEKSDAKEEIGEQIIKEEPSIAADEMKESGGGVMVVYDAPRGEGGSIIEINTPMATGKMKVDVEIERTGVAKAGLVMAISGAVLAIAGTILGVWYGRNQILVDNAYHWDPTGFTLTTVFLGIGFVLLLIGVVLTSYGKKIRHKL